MTRTVEISEEAYSLLFSHRKDAGFPKSVEDEMDELFTVADQVWSIMGDAARTLAIIRKRVNK